MADLPAGPTVPDLLRLSGFDLKRPYIATVEVAEYADDPNTVYTRISNFTYLDGPSAMDRVRALVAKLKIHQSEPGSHDLNSTGGQS